MAAQSLEEADRLFWDPPEWGWMEAHASEQHFSRILRTTLGNMTNFPADVFNSKEDCTDQTQENKWKLIHPCLWVNSQVLDWIYYVAADYKLTDVSGESFKDVCGAKLVKMSHADFLSRDKINGHIFQRHLHSLLRSDPVDTEYSVQSELEFSSVDFDDLTLIEHSTLLHESISVHDHAHLLEEQRHQIPSTVEAYESMDTSIGPSKKPQPTVPSHSSFCCSKLQEVPTIADQPNLHRLTERLSSEGVTNSVHDWVRTHSVESDAVVAEHPPMSVAELHRPRNGVVKIPKKRGRKRGQISKGPHLWEFIRDMLLDVRYNPKIIKWENNEEGVFRIVESTQVSNKWGEHKKNTNMTYEKFSRAMRFSRQEGYFTVIPKDGRYSKKLLFKFGPKSHGWKQDY